MEYVEMLRARRVLTWYTAILVALSALVVTSVYAGHGTISGENGTLLASDLLLACAFGAWVVTTCAAPGLAAEMATIPIIWTRPMSRTAIAARYVAVDVVTIAIGYAVTVAVVLLCLAAFGVWGALHVNGGTFGAIGISLGSALMWYGLVALVTARFGRGGLVAGLSWAAFLVVGGLWAAPLPPVLHGIVSVLNFLNPIAYFGGISSSHNGDVHRAIQLPETVRMVMAWAIAVAATAGAVRLWSTREV